MEGYIKVPVSVLRNTAISPMAKLLYGEVALLCQAKGYCWATNSHLSAVLGVSKRTVTRLLAELQEAGFIHHKMVVNQISGMKRERLLRLAGVTGAAVAAAAPRQEEAVGTTENGKKNDSPAMDIFDDTPVTSPAMAAQEEPDDAELAPMEQVELWMASQYPDWSAQAADQVYEAIESFLEHCERQRRPLRSWVVISLLCKRLTDISGGRPHTMAKQLKHAVLNGWTWVYPLTETEGLPQPG